MKKDVEYLRYSSHNQDDGFSIEYQKAEIKAHAEKNGIIIDESYIDEAKTGTKVAGRDAFYNLIREVKNGNINSIVVYKLSRMFRNAQESQYYRDLFRNKSVKIISVTEHIDEESTSGRLSTNILSVIDQYQSEIISDHVKSSMREMVRQGYYTGGRVIFGYKLQAFKHGSKERKKFIIDENEAEIVTMIFEMYAKGQNRAQIMNILIAQDITDRMKNFFPTDQLRSMLLNDFYIGVRRYSTQGYDDIVIENSHPAIIDISLWNMVQDRLKIRRNITPRKKKHSYPFTGKIYCECGSHCFGISGFSTRNGQRYEYCSYVCAKKKKYRTCSVSQFSKERLEETVIKKINQHILNASKIDDLANEIFKQYKSLPNDLNREISDCNKEITSLNKRIDVLIDMRINGELSGELIKQRSAPLEEQLYKAQKKLTALSNQHNSVITLDKVKNYLSEMLIKSSIMTEEVKEELFNQFVDKIILKHTNVEIYLRVFSTPFFAYKGVSASPNIALSANIKR